MTMTADQAKQLRAPFKPEQIGKLPKPTKKENPKGKCQECGGWHGLPAVHLDYVGHAATTDRLLQVDPSWTWEPMAYGPNGEPLMTNGGLWIKLTVCGVTRPGFGDGNTPKEIIGDAIRNAAMRFGVALDLWAKEDLSQDRLASGEPVSDNSERSEAKGKPAAGDNAAELPDTLQSDKTDVVSETVTELRGLILQLAKEHSDELFTNTTATLVKKDKETPDKIEYAGWLEKQLDRMKEHVGAGPKSPFQAPDKAKKAAA